MASTLQAASNSACKCAELSSMNLGVARMSLRKQRLVKWPPQIGQLFRA